MSPTPSTVRLQDYRPYPYSLEATELRFDLYEDGTRVDARLSFILKEGEEEGTPLVLYGVELDTLGLRIDGEPLGEADYQIEGETLTIPHPPTMFTLEVATRIHPERNTALEGLYQSGGNFCTQCEAEGFRKITWYPDRPDVLSVFTTTVIADPKYVHLLSNGNLMASGETEDGERHYATWRDPHPKPSYLFALVAGDLACVEDSFTTVSGREVAIRFYVQHGNESRCDHAIDSLKRAMRWDEEVYGREYDLDVYMVVAVDDFNMGAMENKGLNVFNSRYVLASPESATDADYAGIEGVIAHEYFHNWSGNRVTCRDWFQLSLKEGFTVFRDQCFSADMLAAAVQRIEDVAILRSHQFAEDAGPMAHPVRPQSYVEINNFYTMTVYNKGAEVVRMLHTLLGAEGFRQGTDHYFNMFDGEAVTTDDFVASMESANGVDLSLFRRWYDQAGTPRVSVERRYDAANGSLTLTLRQSCPPTPGQADKLPFHIPVATALFGPDGAALPLRLEGETEASGTSRVLSHTEAEQSFTFVDLPAEPVPSLLRGFSAPVRLDIELADAELALLMAHDDDPFNRWEAGQRLALRVLLAHVEALRKGERPALDAGLSAAFGQSLSAPGLDQALIAKAITLPDEAYIGEFLDPIEPGLIHDARRLLRRQLTEAHRDALLALYRSLHDTGEYQVTAEAMGRRALKNAALGYLLTLGDAEAIDLAVAQFRAAANMTDVMAALSGLVGCEEAKAEREEALAAFHAQWRHDNLVLDKWFTLQATSPLADTLEQVVALKSHPDFTLANPNRVRALIGAFALRNPARFHAADGAGYRLLADLVLELNARNPQIAARLLGPLTRWRAYAPNLAALMRAELERIQAHAGLSNDVFEVVSKSLEG